MMNRKPQPAERTSDRKDTKGDRGDMHRTGDTFEESPRSDRTRDMRKANENTRKSQGDQSGPRPAIDP